VIEARGNVLFQEPRLTVSAPQGSLNLDSGALWVERARYRIPERHARGEAAEARREQPDVLELEQASFTTCPSGDDAWKLVASRVTLDRAEGIGTARHARFEVRGVPVLYTPYVRFPIDDRRRSGFLTPSIGSTSRSGFQLVLPLYLNLAPNYDATLTGRYLEERGLQGIGELRYLLPGHSGRLAVALLDDGKAERLRSRFDFQHRSRLTGRWTADLRYQSVSDQRYFTDLGDTLGQTSRTHLARYANLQYSAGTWRLLAQAQDFQTIDPDIAPVNYPYQRLPRLDLLGRDPRGPWGLDTAWHGEWVRFGHAEKTTGMRLDGSLEVRRPFEQPAWHVTPTAGFRVTGYALDGDPSDERPLRALPYGAVEAGLAFERPWSNGTLVQTLEPRARYLYVPYADQTDIPIFDTNLFDFSYAQLFRNNRFSGADRVGDANQLSLALESALLHPATGRVLAGAGLGQIVYFSDRRVTLPGRPPDTARFSNLVGEAYMEFGGGWRLQGELQWDPEAALLDRAAVAMRYRDPEQRLFNLAYRERFGVLQLFDVSMALPITRHLRGVARWSYDLRNDNTQDALAALEYDTCCWALRLALRRVFRGDIDGDPYNDSFQFQLVLKGFTSIGDDIDALLARDVVGYLPDEY
jgi:LPS-assembly protein